MGKIRPLEILILLFVMMYSLIPSYLGIRVGGVLFNAQRGMIIAMIGLLTIEAAANGRTIPRVLRVTKRSIVGSGFVVLYIILRFTSAFQSDDLSLSLNSGLSDILSASVFLYIGVYYARDLTRVNRLITVIVVTALMLCILGLVEAMVGRNLVASIFPMPAVSDDFMKLALADKVRGTYRVQSTFIHPLAFGSYLVLVLPLAIYCVKRARTAGMRTIFLGAIALMWVNAIFTGSRAAVLVMGLILLVHWIQLNVGILKSRSHLKRAIGIFNLCLVLLVIAVAIPIAQNMISGKSEDEKSSSAGRIVQLTRGAQSVADHPLLGVGPRMAGKYAGISDSYGATVDNWYLTIVVESGIVALVCFVSILLTIVWQSIRLARAYRDKNRLVDLFHSFGVSVGAFGLFLVILSLHDETFPFLFLLLGTLFSLVDLTSEDPRKGARKIGYSRGRMARR